MCLSVWYFFIRCTYSLARHCIETADSGKHEKTDHSLFNGMWRDRSPFFYMAWQIALHNIMWHWPSVTYFISHSLPDEALIIHCVFQQLLQPVVLFVMVFPKALPNDVEDAYAHFGDMLAVKLKKKNDFNLIGAVPGRYMYQVFLSFPLLGSSISHQAFHSTPSIT